MNNQNSSNDIISTIINSVNDVCTSAKDSIIESIKNCSLFDYFKDNPTEKANENSSETLNKKASTGSGTILSIIDDSVKNVIQISNDLLSTNDFSIESLYKIFINNNVNGEKLDEISKCIENKKLDILKRAYENPNLVVSDEYKIAGLEIAVIQNNPEAFKIIANSVSNISVNDFKRLLSYANTSQNITMISTIINNTKGKVSNGSEISKETYSELFKNACYNGDEMLLKSLIKNVPDEISMVSYGYGLNSLIQKEKFDLLYLLNSLNNKISKQDIEQAKISLLFVCKNKENSSTQNENNFSKASKVLRNLERGITPTQQTDSVLNNKLNNSSLSSSNGKGLKTLEK